MVLRVVLPTEGFEENPIQGFIVLSHGFVMTKTVQIAGCLLCRFLIADAIGIIAVL